MTRKPITPAKKALKKDVKKTAGSVNALATNTELVNEFMHKLIHPFKAEIEAVRTIIKNSSNHVSERIKWNAPSFFYKEDILTIHVKAIDHILLIFHHPAIVKIGSPLLEGDYKDRRLTHFHSIKEINASKIQLQHILKQLIKYQEK